MESLIIHHNADPDGFFSGAVALLRYPSAKVMGYNYEADFSEYLKAAEGKDVYMLDCSPKNWVDMHRLCEVANSVTWIDHHKTAYDTMTAEDTWNKYTNFTVEYDTAYGACVAAWRYFFPEEQLPNVIKWVGQYDVYNDYGSRDWYDFIYPLRMAVHNDRDVHEILRKFHNFDIESGKYGDVAYSCIIEGRAILNYVTAANEAIVNDPQKAWVNSFTDADGNVYKVLWVNAAVTGDFFKDYRGEEVDFFVGFGIEKGCEVYSLRSKTDNYDLGKIAKGFGGGGHKRAAGFKLVADTHESLPKGGQLNIIKN